MRIEICLSDGITSHEVQVEAPTISQALREIGDGWSEMLHVAWIRLPVVPSCVHKLSTTACDDEADVRAQLLQSGMYVEGKVFPITDVMFRSGVVHSLMTSIGQFKARKIGVIDFTHE